MAKRLQVNTLLSTRDGRDIGNAIVTAILDRTSKRRYRIKTDYGNVSVLHREEIEVFFHIGAVAEPDHKHYVTPS